MINSDARMRPGKAMLEVRAVGIASGWTKGKLGRALETNTAVCGLHRRSLEARKQPKPDVGLYEDGRQSITHQGKGERYTPLAVALRHRDCVFPVPSPPPTPTPQTPSWGVSFILAAPTPPLCSHSPPPPPRGVRRSVLEALASSINSLTIAPLGAKELQRTIRAPIKWPMHQLAVAPSPWPNPAHHQLC